MKNKRLAADSSKWSRNRRNARSCSLSQWAVGRPAWDWTCCSRIAPIIQGVKYATHVVCYPKMWKIGTAQIGNVIEAAKELSKFIH